MMKKKTEKKTKKITSFMEYEEGQEGDFLFFQALHFSTFSFYLFNYF